MRTWHLKNSRYYPVICVGWLRNITKKNQSFPWTKFELETLWIQGTSVKRLSGVQRVGLLESVNNYQLAHHRISNSNSTNNNNNSRHRIHDQDASETTDYKAGTGCQPAESHEDTCSWHFCVGMKCNKRLKSNFLSSLRRSWNKLIALKCSTDSDSNNKGNIPILVPENSDVITCTSWCLTEREGAWEKVLCRILAWERERGRLGSAQRGTSWSVLFCKYY